VCNDKDGDTFQRIEAYGEIPLDTQEMQPRAPTDFVERLRSDRRPDVTGMVRAADELRQRTDEQTWNALLNEVNMYERFTDGARKVMQCANTEAKRYDHEYIGVEHLLLGLVRVVSDEPAEIAAIVLRQSGVDPRKLRLETEKLLTPGHSGVTMGKLPQTPRAKQVVELAMQAARDIEHNYVGAEHLLLGLLRTTEGTAAVVLMQAGLTANAVQQMVVQVTPPQSSQLQVATSQPREAQPPVDAMAAVALQMMQSAFDADPAAVYALVCNRVPCTPAIVDHPHVLAETVPTVGALAVVGMLGFINGLLAAQGSAYAVATRWTQDARPQLLGFQLTPNQATQVYQTVVAVVAVHDAE